MYRSIPGLLSIGHVHGSWLWALAEPAVAPPTNYIAGLLRAYSHTPPQLLRVGHLHPLPSLSALAGQVHQAHLPLSLASWGPAACLLQPPGLKGLLSSFRAKQLPPPYCGCLSYGSWSWTTSTNKSKMVCWGSVLEAQAGSAMAHGLLVLGLLTCGYTIIVRARTLV